MSRVIRDIKEKDKRLFDWQVITVLIGIMVMLLVYALNKFPETIRVYPPPDLANGSEMMVGEIPKSTLYSFTYYVYQTITSWEKDGEVDGFKKLEDFSCYITDDFLAQLKSAHQSRIKNKSAQGRTRNVREAYESGYSPLMVNSIGNRIWEVKLALKVKEFLGVTKVRDTAILYRVQVVPEEASKGCNNPWELKLSGLTGKPQRILISTDL